MLDADGNFLVVKGANPYVTPAISTAGRGATYLSHRGLGRRRRCRRGRLRSRRGHHLVSVLRLRLSRGADNRGLRA